MGTVDEHVGFRFLQLRLIHDLDTHTTRGHPLHVGGGH